MDSVKQYNTQLILQTLHQNNTEFPLITNETCQQDCSHKKCDRLLYAITIEIPKVLFKPEKPRSKPSTPTKRRSRTAKDAKRSGVIKTSGCGDPRVAMGQYKNDTKAIRARIKRLRKTRYHAYLVYIYTSDFKYVHANAVVVDNKKSVADLFDPYGTKARFKEAISGGVRSFLQDVYGKSIKFRGYEKWKLAGPQDDSSNDKEKFNDPVGYCSTWVVFYTHLALSCHMTPNKFTEFVRVKYPTTASKKSMIRDLAKILFCQSKILEKQSKKRHQNRH